MPARKQSAPKGEEWSGRRVRYVHHKGAAPEFGTVLRMASGKVPAAFVTFDGEAQAKLVYIQDLEELQ